MNEAELAEAVTLLVLSKKANAIWGGVRGRSIGASDCKEAVKLIDEAVINGARLSKACDCLGITERTYYRWQKLNKTYESCEDRRAFFRPFKSCK